MDSLSLVIRPSRRGLMCAVVLVLLGAWFVAAVTSTAPARLPTVPGFSVGSCIDPMGCPREVQGPTVDPNGLAAGGAMDPNGAPNLLAVGSVIDPNGASGLRALGGAIDPDGSSHLLAAGCGIDPNGSCHPTGQTA